MKYRIKFTNPFDMIEYIIIEADNQPEAVQISEEQTYVCEIRGIEEWYVNDKV